MKITVLYEGRTEYYFVQNVLSQYLPSEIEAIPLPISGTAFGNVPFETVHLAALDELTKSNSSDVITTMVDLYELTQWPEMEALPIETPLQRVRRIENLARIKFEDERFLPYIQLHEYEALLFVDFDVLGKFIDPVAAKTLGDELSGRNPEDINDGSASAPSKRIIAVDARYEHSKARVGPIIAKQVGIPRLRDSCPHFDEWISTLENLARGG